MAANHNLGGNYWGYLVNKDKSPTPIFEQLCLGIASFIATLEPKTTDNLVPQKLAAFYRAVGGDYDSLFLSTPSSSLSLIYRTLGCFHTLQPTANPFETPSMPALLPCGYVRWQTMQLLLCPEEHVSLLQATVRRFDITNPITGATFPKVIPHEAFPDRADPDILKWHENLSQKLEQDYRTRKIQASPYISPRDGPSGIDAFDQRKPANTSWDYFANPPTRPPYDRRPSLPHLWPHGKDAKYFWASESPAAPPAQTSNPNTPKSPTHPGHRRTSNSSTAHRSSHGSKHRPSPSSFSMPRPATHTGHGPPPAASNGVTRHRHHPSTSSRPRSPSTIEESSGSDASSENSAEQKYHRRRSSLFPPEAPVHHRRRHSHDDIYSNGQPPVPPRSNGYPHAEHNKDNAKVYYNHVPGAQPTNLPAPPRNKHAVKFREYIFDGPRNANGGSASAPDTPGANGQPQRKFQYFDPTGKNNNNSIGSGPTSGNDSEETSKRRKFGVPIRVRTVTGVGGRKYASPKSATPVAAKASWD